MSIRLALVACVLAPVAMTVRVGEAAPVVFSTSAGGTGNAYEVFLDDTITGGEAHQAAAAVGGYLVSITSPAEQSFIEDLLTSAGAPTGSYWMGLERVSGTDDEFAWSSGESFEFADFAVGEPNSYLGQENFGQIYWSQDVADDINNRRGQWNDAVEGGYPDHTIPELPSADLARGGFIIERAVVETDPPPVPIPLPPAVVAAPLAALIAGFVSRRVRRR